MEDKHSQFFKYFLPEISSHRLKIPKLFFKKYNGTIPTNAILRVPSGNIWLVKLKANRYDHWFIEDGWESFVSDNHVVDGDCLLFRYDLVNLFDVTIFSRDGCYKEIGASSSVNITQQVISRREDTEVKVVTKTDEDADISKVCVGNSGAVVMRKSYLTSGFLHLPKHMIKTYLGIKDQTIKLKVGTRFWDVNYRSGNFMGGWGAFRRDNGLQLGDECRFSVTELDPIVMNVTILRSY